MKIREEYAQTSRRITVTINGGMGFDMGPLGRIATAQFGEYENFGSGPIDSLIGNLVGTFPLENLLQLTRAMTCLEIYKIHAIERGGVGKQIVVDILERAKEKGVHLVIGDTVTPEAHRLMPPLGFVNYETWTYATGIQMRWMLRLSTGQTTHENRYVENDSKTLRGCLTAAMDATNDRLVKTKIAPLLTEQKRILSVSTPYLSTILGKFPLEVKGQRVYAYLTEANREKMVALNPNSGWIEIPPSGYAFTHIHFGNAD